MGGGAYIFGNSIAEYGPPWNSAAVFTLTLHRPQSNTLVPEITTFMYVVPSFNPVYAQGGAFVIFANDYTRRGVAGNQIAYSTEYDPVYINTLFGVATANSLDAFGKPKISHIMFNDSDGRPFRFPNIDTTQYFFLDI